MDSYVGLQDIVVIGEFAEPTDVANVILRAGDRGDYLRLGDIAEVVLDYEDWREGYFYSGNPSILIDVSRDSDSNELVVIKAVEDALDKYRLTLPVNVQIEILANSSGMTRSLLSSLLDNALIGAFLIIVTLLMFFPWRTTTWVVAGLPVAILFALALSQSIGIGITAPVLVAIIMMLGLLVDDAIVCSESVYSYYERGCSPDRAAVEGIGAVGRPIITGALTTMLAMTPLLMLGGNDAKWLWVLPAMVVCLVLGSLFECIFLLPSHIAESLKQNAKQGPRGVWFTHLEKLYRRMLNYYLLRPYKAVLVLLFFLSGSMLLIKAGINFQPYPPVDSNDVVVVAELPVGASFESTGDALIELERNILESDAGRLINSSYIVVGEHGTGALDNLIEGQKKNWGKVTVTLKDFNERSITAMEIANQLQRELAIVAQNFSYLSVEPIRKKPPIGFPVQLGISGAGENVGRVAEEILEFLRQDASVSRAWSNYAPGVSTIELDIDHNKLADYGLKVSQLTKALQVAYNGVLVEELQTPKELIRFRLQLQDQYRHSAEAIHSLTVINDGGLSVPLRNVASFISKEGESSIFHYAGEKTETVFAEIHTGKTTVQKINAELQDFIEGSNYHQLYPGINFHFAGAIVAQAETASTMGGGLVLIVLSIFFIMVLLFNSLYLPLTTMLVIPVSFITVLLIFTIQGTVISMEAVVGFLGLTGVLVNGSLVMIDRIQKLEGVNADGNGVLSVENIVDGAVSRLRPLFITGLTALVGLGPAAFGFAGSDPNTEKMLLVMFLGVAVGSLATLFALPIFLAIGSNLMKRFVRDSYARL